MPRKYDAVIIGGGFYGLRIAQFLYDELGFRKIRIIEKDKSVMQRASYNNQARVHGGYHYPRSVLTAVRSKVNLPIFAAEYEDSIVSDFVKYYAVAKNFSQVTANQFLRFFKHIDAEISPAPEARKYFTPQLIEEVFLVQEFAFNAAKLKKSLLKNLSLRGGIKICTDEEVQKVSKNISGLEVITSKSSYQAKRVLNTAYSSINKVNLRSKLPIIPLKHELTELCLVEIPPALRNKAFTVMCGPFFSLMPFPPRNLTTLSHVRYTPHSEWYDDDKGLGSAHYSGTQKPRSHFAHMLADVKRFMVEGHQIKHTGDSLWEVKTVLPQSEADDSRPILFRAHHGGLKNYICIMGGKIDNIYDVFRELKKVYA